MKDNRGIKKYYKNGTYQFDGIIYIKYEAYKNTIIKERGQSYDFETQHNHKCFW